VPENDYIDKYEILSTLGRGSMGVVYKANDPEIGRLVAIKTLRSIFLEGDAKSNEALARFKQESRSAGRLHHPNIVMVFEAGRVDKGSPYIVMEYIEGTSLEQIIAQKSALDPVEALHYLSQIASAIDYAHSQNVIHRDIKPSNILIDSKYRPHLLDFGVAKISDTSLTPAGTVVGTPSYMSPEQIRGETLDSGTDLFAFSVVAFELFTGVRPFPGKDFTTVVSNILHKDPIPFKELDTSLPKEVEQILHKGLAKDRAERITSAITLVKEISELFSVPVDETGIIGGYHHGITIDDFKPKKNGASYVKKGNDSVNADTEATNLNLPQSKSETKTSRSTNSPIYLFAGVIVILGVVSLVFNERRLTIPVQKNAFDNTLSLNPQEDVQQEVVEEVILLENDTVVETLSWTENDIPLLDDEQLVLFLKNLASDDSSKEILKQGIVEASNRSNSLITNSIISLSEHTDYLIRIEALKALSKPHHYNMNDGLEAIIKGLNDDEYLVRGFAARVLGHIPSSLSIQAIEEQFRVEQNEVVKKVMEQSLKRLKEHNKDE
jgi:serine/threonine protein kinase